MGRRGKSLLFYFSVSLAASILCILTGWSFFEREQSRSLGGGVFDKNQYLFAGQIQSSKSFDLNIVESNFLNPSGPAFLVSGRVLGVFGQAEERREIEKYIVREGDNIGGIAQKFDISLETILWANNLSQNSIIRAGQELVILPISGVLHIVRPGDTLSELARLYQAKIEEMVAVNALADPGDIYIGDLLIIPGGQKPKVLQNYVQVPLSGNYFICPIPSPCGISQGLHWFNAVDFTNGKCGEPVFAAAGGTVQRTGYGSVSGNYTRIIHPNEVVTFYGHLSKITVLPGQVVRQGEIIGFLGSTGLTVPSGPDGCHLHFDVRFGENPFARYKVGTKLAK